MSRVCIIAEAGVNHNGDMQIARRMIEAAKDCGADAVKFQLFRAEALATGAAPQAAYQQQGQKDRETQRAMLKRLEINAQDCRDLFNECGRAGIAFLASAFDLESVRTLRALGAAPWKIPSGEITNLPYLRLIGSYRQKVILSTGLSTMEEIESALNVLSAAGTPRSDVTVLHCNTEYPTPLPDVNLKAMISIRDRCGVSVGYSDHTAGIEAALAAAALGASIIEKHFTLDRDLPGPDHRSSLEPGAFAEMVQGIRRIETTLGDGEKKPAPSELKNRDVVRKSIVAAKPIQAGERLTEDNLTVKRPAGGISPMQWDSVVGRAARRDYAADEFIEW